MKLCVLLIYPVITLFLVSPSVTLASVICIPELEFHGENAGDRYCAATASAGDVNNDGVRDILIGAPAAGESGRAYVYSGRDGELLYSFYGETAGDSLGFAVASAGDVNGDSFDDLLIGAYGHGGLAGRVYLFSGQTGDTIHVFTGDNIGDKFGFRVGCAGDIDLDDRDDILISAIGDDSTGPERGSVYLYSGADQSLICSFYGTEYTEFGFSLAGIGDINGDNYPDIAIGQPSHYASRGRVFIYSGQTGLELTAFDGARYGDQFGYALAGMGDANLDGYPDIIVGAPFYDG